MPDGGSSTELILKTELFCESLSRRYLAAQSVLPVSEDESSLTLLMADVARDDVVDDIEIVTGKKVIRRQGSRDQIQHALRQLYYTDSSETGKNEAGHGFDPDRLRVQAEEAEVVRYVADLIATAVRVGASDIHLEPMGDGLVVRQRVDGLLTPCPPPPAASAAAVVSRIKILGQMDIAEQRRPQDGRALFERHELTADLRIATLPSHHGESVVIRIVAKAPIADRFTDLGLAEPFADDLTAAIGRPDGLVIVTGPTGSGKTSTLYTALKQLNDPRRKIITVEDPVEIRLPGVVQMPVHRQIGLTFAAALRAVVRQDPDILMIGEVRDRETADIAVHSALTGHLVLTSLHTNDAAGAITRLLDMGVEDYLLASVLKLVVAQRLVRRLCDHCRTARPIRAQDLKLFGLSEDDIAPATVTYEPRGCAQCANTGYGGRTGIFELLDVSEDIRRMIVERVDTAQIKAVAQSGGMRTVAQDGWNKILTGITSIEEVRRVTQL